MAWLAVAGATGPGMAAEETAAPAAPIVLASAGPVETVLVTGVRTAESTKSSIPLIETPQNIQVIPADLIADQGGKVLDDVLRNVAGVMPGGYYQSWDYFRIRGFDASGHIYQDGLQYDSYVQLNVELYGLEQVEVMKGPSSALYGQGSLGGLINLVSKHPRPETFLTLGADYGSFDSYELHLDGNTTLFGNPNIAGRLVALTRHSGTFTEYAKGNDRIYVAPSLTWTIDPDTSLTVLTSFQRDRTDMGFPLTYVGAVVPGPYGRYPLDRYTGEPDRSNRSKAERTALGFEFRHRFNDVFSFTQNFRYTSNWSEWDHILYSSYLDADGRTLYRYPYSSNGGWLNYGSDSRLQAAFETGPLSHTIVAGVDHYTFVYRWAAGQIDYADPAAYMPLDLYAPVYGQPMPVLTWGPSSRESIDDTGLYLQDHIRYDAFTLTLSGRWDFAKSGNSAGGVRTTESIPHFTPRVGLTYAVTPQAVLYTSYSESFLPQSGLTFAGEALKPETGRQWEAGIKSSLLDDRLDLTAALFQLTRQNVSTDDQLHPGFSVQTGEQRSRGFELDAHATLAPGWQTILTYAYIDVGVLDDNTIPIGDHPQNAPVHSVGLWNQYELQDGMLKGLSMGAGLYYYSSQAGDLPNTFKLPGYTLLNAMLGYDFGPARLQLNVRNILNARYFTGSYNDVYVQPGAPRNATISLEWSL